MYDLVIIGAGPAGITASIYAGRKRMDFVTIAKDVGGQMNLSADIENYVSYQLVTGMELTGKFRTHLAQYKTELKDGEEVISIAKHDKGFVVKTDADEYGCRTALICSGKIPRRLNVKGEEEFKNKGVAYCATCDGPLFAGLDVAVVGGGNSGLDAVLQLRRIANRIYLINVADELPADRIMSEKIENDGKVVIYNSTRVMEILGDRSVNGIKLRRGEKEEMISVRGVFVEIGYVPNAGFMEEIEKNRNGEIVVNCKCETNIPGIFAAGDVTSVPSKQIIVACGEGAKAVLSVFEYINRLNDKFKTTNSK